MVTRMLQQEFSLGLRSSGLYEDKVIEGYVQKIVNITHDVRHKGLIERIFWVSNDYSSPQSSTDTTWIHEDGVIFKDDELRNLVQPAQVGCAFRILNKIENLKNYH